MRDWTPQAEMKQSCAAAWYAEAVKSVVTSERLALIAVVPTSPVCFHRRTAHQDGLAVSTATARHPTRRLKLIQ